MELKDNINKVKEFHEVFGLEFHEQPNGSISKHIYELRHRLMQEENDEYLEACEKGDLNLIADALGDKMYILLNYPLFSFTLFTIS